MAILKSRKALPGVRLKHDKNTAELSTVSLPLPRMVRIPMQQHMGQEAVPTVAAGDTVYVGQKIADCTAPMGIPMHSSVSGTVKNIERDLTSGGKFVKTIVIETDGKQMLSPDIAPPSVSNRAEFIAAVRESGLSGLGGAGFPTHLKLNYPNIDRVDTLIINAAECEPYITSDYRECMEHPQDIVDGIKIVMSYLALSRCVIGVEQNKPSAIVLLSQVTNLIGNVAVMPLKNRYPQGAEKVLIYSTTGRVVQEGQLPADCGVIVMNVSTIAALARYFKTGMPLISRRVTVAGDAVSQPKNVEVLLGTPIKEVLTFCGCNPEECKEILMGGPMMGVSVPDVNLPVIKNNNAILAFRSSQISDVQTTACIRCGKCIRVCPMKLMPAALERAYDNRNSEALQSLKVNLCINCGCCSYVCPAKRNLASKNQLAKILLREKKS